MWDLQDDAVRHEYRMLYQQVEKEMRDAPWRGQAVSVRSVWRVHRPCTLQTWLQHVLAMRRGRSQKGKAHHRTIKQKQLLLH
jgi:hypothetical protein